MDNFQKAKEELKKIPGVTGVGLTHSTITRIGNEHQIVVYLKDDTPITQNLIPKSIFDIPVVYKITGKAQIHAFAYTKDKLPSLRVSSMQFTNKVRPVESGVSGGLYGSQLNITGTLGCFVKDINGNTVILSNNHVLAWNIDSMPYKGFKGEPIIQPGSVDGGTFNDYISTLEKYVPLTSCVNTVDAAHTSPLSDMAIKEPNMCNLYTNEAITAQIGMPVKKAGRTTQCVDGIIESTDLSFDVDYTLHTRNGDITKTLTFNDVITIVNSNPNIPISQEGDSGSMWVTSDTNNAIGLNFAGTIDGLTSVSCKASNIEKLLCVKFGTGVPIQSNCIYSEYCPTSTSTTTPNNVLLLAGISAVAFLILVNN